MVGPAQPPAVQGSGGPSLPPLLPQDGHQEDLAGAASHDLDREFDPVLLCPRLRVQDGHGVLVRCHGGEDLQSAYRNTTKLLINIALYKDIIYSFI